MTPPRSPATDLRTIARNGPDADNARRRLAEMATTPAERRRFLTLTPSEARAELAARGIDPRGRDAREAPMVHVHFYMPPALRQRLDAAAGERGVSRSDYIRAAVEAMLDKEGA